jgi:hypothetical protein
MTVDNHREVNRLLAEAKEELARLDLRRAELLEQIAQLRREESSILHSQNASLQPVRPPLITNQSSQSAKIGLFRSLFRGREDVYPRRFESRKTGKNGYQPVCRNEWVSGICEKPKIRCSNCNHREFLPVTDDVIANHLLGTDQRDQSRRDFTIGVYPMLPDETCWFLATDFDKHSWAEDAGAFLQ